MHTINKTAITKLLHEFQFHLYSRKSTENKSATNPPQKYSVGRISAEKFHCRPNGRKKFDWSSFWKCWTGRSNGCRYTLAVRTGRSAEKALHDCFFSTARLDGRPVETGRRDGPFERLVYTGLYFPLLSSIIFTKVHVSVQLYKFVSVSFYCFCKLSFKICVRTMVSHRTKAKTVTLHYLFIWLVWHAPLAFADTVLIAEASSEVIK